MIFASDLDRTLIYSRSFTESENSKIVVVEQKEGQDLSFATQTSINLLTNIHEKCLFIPTTTRSLEQYKRISLFQEQIVPKYAVVANGGLILKHGKVLESWQKIIQSKMSSILEPEKLIERCNFFLKNSYINSHRCCDNIFAYAVLKGNSLNTDDYDKLKSIAAEQEYVVTRNGRKIYIIPSFINKWEPLKHIMELEGESEIITAGDSILDLPMLANSRYGLVPSHGELCKLYKEALTSMSNISFTNIQGIKASHEFLQAVIKKLA